jgi:dihydroxyacetone kinase
MTRIFEDPAEFTADAVAGFVDLYSGLVRPVTGGVVRRRRPANPKVAIIVGGGSGHYPAFMGVVGEGFADGAVVGNIFTSPSTAQAYSVGRAANSGMGVIYTYGNYAGDVMNFGLAGERLEAEGVPARQLIVTDDIASAPEIGKRRGIAGDFPVFKILGAAAERGLDLDAVMALGHRANAATFTLGLAFSGCTFPGADEPLFTVPAGAMGLGLGIHGEPGLEDVPSLRARDLATLLVSRLLAERPDGSGDRVAVILNGLGATKYEELFGLWSAVAPLLRDAGLTIVSPEVGELVTSLDMGGVSLTITWLDEELEELWNDPCLTPAFRRGAVTTGATGDEPDVEAAENAEAAVEVTPGDEASRQVASTVLAALEAAQAAVREAEGDLGRLDAVAGDGDHGRGMVRGLDHAVAAARRAANAGAGAAGLLAAAGDAWAEYAGGTSGVLWGAGLRALGAELGDAGTPGSETVVQAWQAWLQALTDLGKAQVGDKTLLDAAVPFVETLRSSLDTGLQGAWERAVAAADVAAQATAELSPKVGRARPLAARSMGHPDPGAISFVICVRAAAGALGDGN